MCDAQVDAVDEEEQSLSEDELDRLADLVRLQPTKNSELQATWGMDSGGEVHSYLEEHLGSLYYRDEESLIRATAGAVDLLDEEFDTLPIQVTELEYAIVETLPGPTERSQSVVATLHDLESSHAGAQDLDAETVRRALRSLARKGVVEVVQRTVPTFKLARPERTLSFDVA